MLLLVAVVGNSSEDASRVLDVLVTLAAVVLERVRDSQLHGSRCARVALTGSSVHSFAHLSKARWVDVVTNLTTFINLY